MFIRRRKLREHMKLAYEKGINKGYELAWQNRQVERDNKGFIIGSKLDQELDEILGGKR